MTDIMRYPVQIETTETYVVWVEAEDPEDAVRSVRDDSEWYEYLRDASPVSSDVNTTKVDPWCWDAENGVYHEPMGPVGRCRICDAPSHSVRAPLQHTDRCPVQFARTTGYLLQNMTDTGRRRALNALRGR